MAKELGFSLGKLNYCLNALIEKGLVKSKTLTRSKKKLIMSIYLPKGNFLKNQSNHLFYEKKMAEYDEVKELEE